VLPLLPERLVGRIVAGRLAEALGREVTVEGARLSLFSGLRARGIVVKERAGFGEGAFARVESLEATPLLGSLLAGQRRFGRIALENAELCLVRDGRGILNASDFAEREAQPFRYGRLTAANLRVRYRDLGSGGEASATLPSVAVGPVAGGRRPLRAAARLASGGAALVAGDVAVTPGEDFDHAELDVALSGLAVGRLAAAVGPRRSLPRELEGAMLSGRMRLEVSVERILRGEGRLELYGLPNVPQLGLVGSEAGVDVTLRGELSAVEPHLHLAAVSRPGEAARLTASLQQVVADGSVPSFAMDNYVLDARLVAQADLSRGGLPGTAIAAGRGSVLAWLRGTMARADFGARASLRDAQVCLADAARAPLAPAFLDLDGGFSLKELAAELRRLVAETEGIRLSARAEARPARGARAAIAPDGALPPMSGGASVGVEVDLARWSEGLRLIFALPRDRPAAGTLGAAARAVLDDGTCRHELRLEMQRVPLDHDAAWLAELPLLAVIRAVVGGRPEAMDCTASLRADLAARGVGPRELAATLTGRGELRLARLRILGAPLFRLLADWSGRPELRDVTFARAEAPFTVADERIACSATLPYGDGALVFDGHTALNGNLHYFMRVTRPREVAFIPRHVVEYLEAGLPLIRISGTDRDPAARILTESILDFTLKRKPR